MVPWNQFNVILTVILNFMHSFVKNFHFNYPYLENYWS